MLKDGTMNNPKWVTEDGIEILKIDLSNAIITKKKDIEYDRDDDIFYYLNCR